MGIGAVRGTNQEKLPVPPFPSLVPSPQVSSEHLEGLRKREETWALAGDSSQLHSCKKKPTPKTSKPMKVSESILLRQGT